MLVHAGKYRTEDKLKMQTINKLNSTQKKQTTQNYPGLVVSYDIRVRERGGLILQCSRADTGNIVA